MHATKLVDLAGGNPIQHWSVLGPFIMKTSAQFEREYLYERDRILDVDYLAADGGEAAVRPRIGQSHKGTGAGPTAVAWQAHEGAELNGNLIAGDAIYETVQRNCVIYAATIVDAAVATQALLTAYHSGMKVWVNGNLVCSEPYGMPKGVRLSMAGAVIPLNAGENLILIKFRPGYISDGIDFCVRDVQVAPLVCEKGLPIAIGRIRPTSLFMGTAEAPRQMIEGVLVNTSHEEVKAAVSVTSSTLRTEGHAEVVCPPGAAKPIRVGLPTPRSKAGKPVLAVLSARLYGRELHMPFEYKAAKPPRHDGTTMVLTSFHFDTTYHEEQRVYAMGAFDIVRQYCRLHREDRHFRSTISEVDYLKPYFDVFPEDRATLLKAFRENRSNSDVMYNQPNEQNCSGEALVRNFLYGQLFHGRVLGQICHVYAPGDVFGHPNQLSQIARKSGCIGVSWDKYIYNFPPLFSHLSLDGSSLPHKRGDWTWDEADEMNLSVVVGKADQTPPTNWHGDLAPKIEQATYRDFMSRVQQECEESGAHLPVTSRDMSQYHAATFMSRINLKIANRLGENTLVSAEKWATLANLLGAKYPAKALDKAWRQILCGQHHDSITGTHNEISYVDLMNSYRETLELSTDVLNRSLDFLGRAIDAGPVTHPLVVFNPLAYERTDVVRTEVKTGGLQTFAIQDHAGKAVPFEVVSATRDKKGTLTSAEIVFVAKKLPSLGYRVYQLVPSEKPLPERRCRAGKTTIENKYFRLEVDPARGGGIVSLYDKKARREVMQSKAAHPGNELAILEELPDRWEEQHEFYTTGPAMFSGEQPAEVEVERGPVSQTLRIRYAMRDLCSVVQELTLTRGVPRLDCRTILLDYQGEDHLFCVTFPVNVRGALPVFDERFGAVTRNESKHYLDFRTHQMVMFSDCAVYGANKWMDYGPSAKVKAGRNTYPLGMVGLITPRTKSDVHAAEEVQRVLIKRGVTCTPWYDKDGPYWGSYHTHMDDDLGYTRFRLSIGSRGRNRYTKKLLAAQPAKLRKAFEQRLAKKGYAYLLVKDGDLADPSWPALPVLLVEAKKAADLTEACEALLAEFPASACITLPGSVDATGGKQAADDYGVALLNEGTYANSVEKGGSLCMMLAHTCHWYGGVNNFPEGYLVPENKNHLFRYAVYPHAGDWREANTQQAAYAYNNPLIARQTKSSPKACLPAEYSFLSVSGKNIILEAMKPFGNPIAGFEGAKKSDAAKGIMLRLYDTEGTDAQVKIDFAAGMKKAWLSDFIEEGRESLTLKDGTASLYVAPFSIETVGFVPGKLGHKIGRKALGAQAEPVQPVWVRSWEHDAESMPMGYGPVVCSIGRKVVESDEGRRLTIKVAAVNDYTDISAKGAAKLIVPEGWSVNKGSIPFDLPPLGHAVTEVEVTRPDAGQSGQIKLQYEHDGQTFQDVLEIGDAFDLSMDVENRDSEILVTLTNPTAETIDCEVSMVTPLETWACVEVGGYSLQEITPRTQGAAVAPGETITLTFRVGAVREPGIVPEASYWAVAKLMSNGRITLKRADRHPVRRRRSAMRWGDMLEEKDKARGVRYRRRWA